MLSPIEFNFKFVIEIQFTSSIEQDILQLVIKTDNSNSTFTSSFVTSSETSFHIVSQKTSNSIVSKVNYLQTVRSMQKSIQSEKWSYEAYCDMCVCVCVCEMRKHDWPTCLHYCSLLAIVDTNTSILLIYEWIVIGYSYWSYVYFFNIF